MLGQEIVQVDEQQSYAIDRIKSGAQIFIDGAAGRGKSVISREVKDYHTIVGAPTGAAALNEGGYTLHKLFKLPLSYPTQRDWAKSPNEVRDLFGNESPVTRLIIGEIGMCRADTLSLISKRLQLARANPDPFGGLQVVVSGDLLQLSPIVGGEERSMFNQQYASPYAFSSPSWNFERIELTKSYRTVDERQIKMLESLRRGDKWSGRALSMIQSEAKRYDMEEDQLHLCCYRKDADDFNQYRFGQHIGTHRLYRGLRTKKSDMWPEAPVPVDLHLKIGCKVLVKANCPSGVYVNGDRGVVTLFGQDFVRVALDRGPEVDVGSSSWEKMGISTEGGEIKEEVESKLEQIPLTLGYAISIHASQGCTLDNAALDIGKGTFADGHLYTGLSRVRDLRNLTFVRPVGRSDLKTSMDVLRFYNRSK
jgi:ATP-dependent DNA helicase PIF1